MKISRIKIKNFRSYKNETEISLQDMTIFLGKNDAGKSTILEALDIFFNESKWCVAIGYDDVNKTWMAEWNEIVEISVCFKDFSDEIILETVPTSVSGEYLVNEHWELEILKRFSWKTMKPATFIVAKHPSNDTFVRDLLIKKISELQTHASSNNIPIEWRWSVSSDIRRAIRQSYENLQFEKQEIPVDKEGAKELWDKIKLALPTYALFQSDRSNTDQDDEVKSPMSVALQSILAEPEIAQKLQEVFEKVKEKTDSVARWTLQQLHGINAELADSLYPKAPDFDKLAWSKAFPKTEIHSDSIPINKRGSGVKRLILLSFFLNEVERRKREEWLSSVIYAFEEPETSQHPEHQKVLVEAFRRLSQSTNTQILLTTHSPYVYKDCIQDGDIGLLHVSNSPEGKLCNNVRDNYGCFPWSPSWWEINYHVYELPTFEFLNELYWYIEETRDRSKHRYADDLLHSFGIQKDEIWTEQSGTSYSTTYITCLRHQLHHPENTNRTIDYRPRLSNAISDLLRVLS